ncbi:MAG: MFS transporter [Planctomycetota bacterium]
MNSLARFRSFTPGARAFLGGAALLEIGHAFQWVLQNLYVLSIGRDVADAGTLNAAGAVAVVLATFPSAWLYERLGPRRSLVLACFLNSLGLAGFALSEGMLPLVLCSGLTGAAYTLHRVVSAPFLVTVSRPHERTHLFQFEFAVHTLMQMVGLLIAGLVAGGLESGLLAETTALRTTLIAGALVGLVGLVPYRSLPKDAGPGAEGAGRSPLAMLRILAPSHWHLWIRISAPHFLVGVGAGLSIPFINLYFTQRFELPKGALGLVMAGSAAMMTCGALFAPRIVERLGFVRATILTEALSIPFFFVLALTTNFPLAVAAFVLRGALMNLSQPLWRNLIMEITPAEWRPAVNGVSMLCWNLGWATSNHWGGVLIDRSPGWLGEGMDGYALPMLLTIAMYVAAIALEARFFWSQRHIGIVASRSGSEGSQPD